MFQIFWVKKSGGLRHERRRFKQETSLFSNQVTGLSKLGQYGSGQYLKEGWWLSPGLENGPLWVHICRMGHNATVAVVATIIVTAAIYSLWALRSRK